VQKSSSISQSLPTSQILWDATNVRDLDTAGHTARDSRPVHAVVRADMMTQIARGQNIASTAAATILHPRRLAQSGSWSRGCSRSELKRICHLLNLGQQRRSTTHEASNYSFNINKMSQILYSNASYASHYEPTYRYLIYNVQQHEVSIICCGGLCSGRSET